MSYLVGYEYISDTKHEIDIFQTPAPRGNNKKPSITTQNIEGGDTIGHISINAKNGEVNKQSTQISSANEKSSDVSIEKSGGCNSGFSATIATIVACSGGCGACWYSLLTKNIQAFFATCGACGGCSIKLYCCAGAAAPDSICSAVLDYIATHPPSPMNPGVAGFTAGVGVFFLDGCRSGGQSCL